MKLWIGNIAPETTEEELRGLLAKYGGAIEVLAVEHIAGDGSRPAAIVDVTATTESLYQIIQRLNGMYWKGRSLTVQSMTR